MHNTILSKLVITALILAAFIFVIKIQNSEPTTPSSPQINSRVVVYTREGCHYCTLAKELLTKNNIPYSAIEISHNADLHNKLVNQTGQTTVPYVFIDNNFIGGYTELNLLHTSNKLDSSLYSNQ